MADHSATLKVVNDAAADERSKEQAIYKACEEYAKAGKPQEVRSLLVALRPYFASLSKAKTAKVVKTMIEHISKVPKTEALQIELCRETIEWCRAEKRTFLRQRMEAKLASLLHITKDYNGALALISSLLREVKRLDDKILLVEIQLLESQVHHSLKNIPKSKASLTAARTAANSIYLSPQLQGEIERMAGMLHSEEGDYKTAYSYFYEAFETFNGMDNTESAFTALMYMCLTKVMINHPEEVASILQGKMALKYSGPALESMRRIALACKERSLSAFQAAAADENITKDPFLKTHLSQLYDTLLEQNLLRIIEPFSCVEIQHVADRIGLPMPNVERKLSQMILDEKFHGILDQGAGRLVLFDAPQQHKAYQKSIEAIENMSVVVDSLYEKIGLLRG